MYLRNLTDRAHRRSGRRAACLELLPTASRVTDASRPVERFVSGQTEYSFEWKRNMHLTPIHTVSVL
jgi:hypothetical protein